MASLISRFCGRAARKLAQALPHSTTQLAAFILAGFFTSGAMAGTYSYRLYTPGLKAAGSVAAAPVGPSDALWDQVSLLMHLDGSNGSTALVEEKGRPVANSGAALSTASFAVGGASLAVSSGKQITVSSAGLAYAGDFTEELFVYYTGGTAAYLDTYTPASGRQFYISNGSLAYYYSGSSNLVSGLQVTPNAWHHLAVTRSGTFLRLFLDGVVVASIDNVVGTLSPAQPQMALNYQQYSGPSYYANGYIDEVRITNGTARYTGNFTPPTTPSPNQGGGAVAGAGAQPVAEAQWNQVSLLLHMNGLNGSSTIVDEKGNAVANSGAVISTSTAAVGSPTSLALSSGNQVTMSAAGLSYSGDFTEEFFVYYTGGVAAYLDTYAYNGLGRQFYIDNGTLQYYYLGGALIQSSVRVTTNAWHHLAAVRYGASLYLFVDGVMVAAKNSVVGTLSPGTQLMALNFQQAGGPRFFANGFIDEVRITNGFARYKENFIPPAAPFQSQ